MKRQSKTNENVKYMAQHNYSRQGKPFSMENELPQVEDFKPWHLYSIAVAM